MAYRARRPIDRVRRSGVAETNVVVYFGPRRHFVQYPLRGGGCQPGRRSVSQARAGGLGHPDELDAAFEGTCGNVRQGIPLMWRDRWWGMFNREPDHDMGVRRIALLGDAAHPPLQYMAQARSWRSRTVGARAACLPRQ